MIVGSTSKTSALHIFSYFFLWFCLKIKKNTPNQPQTYMLAISYTRFQLLKSACAQVQKTEYPLQLGAFIICHKTCFPAGIIALSERFSRQVFLSWLCGKDSTRWGVVSSAMGGVHLPPQLSTLDRWNREKKLLGASSFALSPYSIIM